MRQVGTDCLCYRRVHTYKVRSRHRGFTTSFLCGVVVQAGGCFWLMPCLAADVNTVFQALPGPTRTLACCTCSTLMHALPQVKDVRACLVCSCWSSLPEWSEQCLLNSRLVEHTRAGRGGGKMPCRLAEIVFFFSSVFSTQHDLCSRSQSSESERATAVLVDRFCTLAFAVTNSWSSVQCEKEPPCLVVLAPSMELGGEGERVRHQPWLLYA